MQIYDEIIKYESTSFHLIDVPADRIIYFDIETTGFSPSGSMIYLIGCICLKDGQYHLMQWFADTVESEKEILVSFMDFVKDYSVIVHYNGTGFDIPFIIKKCEIYKIECDFNGIESLDIYKKINNIKNLFNLENLKQKSVEKFLAINRTDKYSGGELINIYYEYLKSKDSSLLNILLLHNHDDVIGMTQILPIINYNCIANREFEVVSVEINETTTLSGTPKKEAVIELALDAFLPKRISGGNNRFYFTACANTARISVEIYTGELKFFYPNYKDYYYLPNEDYSIHKSVAFYVDKDFRTKAKAANCYSKKTGMFLPQYTEIINPYFKIDYYDKITYFEYTEDFVKNKNLVKDYCQDLFSKIINAKRS